ncbi:TetR/AcrR family transcriptional regulator [Rudaeicoccus suwonensis]|uniref:TetR family transcriptional regulator n=1 Tax=Rudaeicoccus suwonensis TaxID=657409 RepID=A0A561E969_9MICO|nr:TetR/AcrR family transcriptional regulator [Rudaeicoccus suwonensis]TWE12178.1 TetR family transcriptional regulator [Rudaeicoccus suwonensis]
MNVPPSTEHAALKPRVEGEREAEIFEGALKVLIDVGYDRLTFDAVAAEVRASKATLYKRWPSKPELLVSAVEYLFERAREGHGAPDTGSLEGDLVDAFCHSGAAFDQMTEIAAAALPALKRDPELSLIFTQRFLEPRARELREVMHRAQARGEIGPDADLEMLSRVLPAMKFHMMLTGEHHPSDEFALQVIQQILLPACNATLATPPNGQKPS